MKIACLGWGSLVWNPGALPIQREWFKDGRTAPVEFTRQSSDGRMTLVIDPTAAPVRLLWALMLPPDLESAKKALRDREGIKGQHWASKIAPWQHGDAAPVNIPELPRWAEAHTLDAAIRSSVWDVIHCDDARRTRKQHFHTSFIFRNNGRYRLVLQSRD